MYHIASGRNVERMAHTCVAYEEGGGGSGMSLLGDAYSPRDLGTLSAAGYTRTARIAQVLKAGDLASLVRRR